VTRIALLAHGAGSCPETALRLLGPAVPDGVEARAVDSRGTVDDVVACLDAAAAGHEVVLVGGVSLGAAAAALWSAAGGAAGELLLAMPAWTGRPDDVAALTAATARDVEAFGIERVLAGITAVADTDDWVLDELAGGWRTYDDVLLAATLRSAASSPGPTPETLARVTARTAVVALADDPLHPVDVARSWAASVPGARFAVVGRHEAGDDRGVLGRVGRRLLDATGTP
jgi:pimeloyl-ACP methyl ester carboxylesterase